MELGFTLVELVVVIFVLSLVAAFVLPSFSARRSTLKKDARTVASLLRYVNETAAMKKETLKVRFDFGQGAVSWDEGGGTKTERLESLRGVELQSRGLVKEGELTVFFGPMGLGEYMWVLLGGEGGDVTVTYNPVSGRVKVT